MKQQMNDQARQRANKPSILLSHDENELVFSLLGRKCQTMSTAVVQLFATDPPAHSSWLKRLNGIVCFVRDSNRRSYFIRVYCLLKHELMWEEEMYESIILNKSREFLICFEGQDRMIALSFASDAEANNFYKIAINTVASRTRKRQDRRSRRFSPVKNDGNDAGHEENESNIPFRHVQKPATSFTQIPQIGINFGNANRERKKPTRKLTKADISMPTNFKHVVHVGWNAERGYDLNNEEVSNLNAFLEKAGVSESQLNDRGTREYIYDFIRTNNVLDSVKSEIESLSPPPIPTRNNTQRLAPPPPPPPVIARSEERISSPKYNKVTPPARPPPIAEPVQQTFQFPTPVAVVPNESAPIPPPPPPPPPMPMMMPNNASSVSTKPNSTNTTSQKPQLTPVNDTRNALMDAIRKGTTLKKVDPAALSTGSGSDDGRSNLLKEIRQGVELRPATERELAPRDQCSGGTDALADALRRALEERSKVLQSSDEDESSDNDEWEE